MQKSFGRDVHPARQARLLADRAVQRFVDRIKMIGAFEHLATIVTPTLRPGPTKSCRPDGVLLCTRSPPDQAADGRPRLAAHVVAGPLSQVHRDRNLPGANLTIEMVEEQSAKTGFTLTRRQSPQPHYARPRPVGRGAAGTQKRGHRDPVRRGLRAVHEIPDRLR